MNEGTLGSKKLTTKLYTVHCVVCTVDCIILHRMNKKIRKEGGGLNMNVHCIGGGMSIGFKMSRIF